MSCLLRCASPTSRHPGQAALHEVLVTVQQVDHLASKRETAQRDDPRWWRTAVIYQIYPRSFADGSGDGVGDIAGIRSRLSYLRDLGVDALWISVYWSERM